MSNGSREEIKQRYDILPLLALNKVAELRAKGAKKHGDNSWRHLPIEGMDSPANHIMKHCVLAMADIADEDGDNHWINIALNAMMQYELELHKEKTNAKD